MTRGQRGMAVRGHADLILADKPSVEAFAAYFETQMRCGKVRRLVGSAYLWFASAGTILTGLGQTYIPSSSLPSG